MGFLLYIFNVSSYLLERGCLQEAGRNKLLINKEALAEIQVLFAFLLAVSFINHRCELQVSCVGIEGGFWAAYEEISAKWEGFFFVYSLLFQEVVMLVYVYMRVIGLVSIFYYQLFFINVKSSDCHSENMIIRAFLEFLFSFMY